MSSHGTYPPVRPPASAEAPTTTIFSPSGPAGGVTSHDQLSNVRFDQHAHSVQQHPDIVSVTPSDGWVLTAQVDGITGAISYTFQAPAGVGGASGTDPFPQYAFAQHGHQYDDIQQVPQPAALNGFSLWTEDFFFANSTKTPAAATIYLHKIMVPATTVFTNLTVVVNTAGTSYTNTQLGVYSSAGTFLAATAVLASAGTNSFGSTGAITVPLSTPITVGGGPATFVWLGLHMGTNAATSVVFAGFSDNVVTANAGCTASTARVGTYTGHATNNLATIGNLTPASIGTTLGVGHCCIGVS